MLVVKRRKISIGNLSFPGPPKVGEKQSMEKATTALVAHKTPQLGRLTVSACR